MAGAQSTLSVVEARAQGKRLKSEVTDFGNACPRTLSHAPLGGKMKRRAEEVYGLIEPSVEMPQHPWLKKKAEKVEKDDTPSDAAIVVDHYARELLNVGLPPLVPRSFIDGTLEDRTSVQQQLEDLGASKLRKFRIQDELMYAWTKDYEAAIRSQMTNNAHPITDLLERFIERIVKKHADCSITRTQLAYLVVLDKPVPEMQRARTLRHEDITLTEQFVSLLFEYSLIIRHPSSTTAYWLHFPNAGALCKQLKAHRTESIARLGRARWKEMLETDLIGRGGTRVLRGVKVELPIDALGADLIGRGIAQRIRTTGGLYYRAPKA